MSFEERGKKEHCECTLRQRITKNSYIQVDRGFYHSNYCLRSLYCGKLQKSLTMAFVLQWVTSSVKIVWKFSQMQLPCLERWNGVLLCKKEQCLICSYQLLGQLSRKPTLLFECFEKALRGNEIFFMDDPPLPSYKQFKNEKFSLRRLSVPAYPHFLYRGGRTACSWKVTSCPWKATSCQCKQKIC